MAFQQDFGFGVDRPLEHVPLRELFPEVARRKWGFASFHEAVHGFVEFVSLNRDETGLLTLTVKDPTGRDRAVLARRDGKWARVRYESIASDAESHEDTVRDQEPEP